jgi:capsular exopolysaccharide synthesis family protein
MNEEVNTPMMNAAGGLGRQSGSQRKPITLVGPQLSFQTSEAVKMLRANIQFSGFDKKVVSLTSCQPNEGKSYIAYELAKSMAEQGKKTLLIDCDIRKSVLKARLNIQEKLPGLSDFLCGRAKIGEIINKTDNPFLGIVLAGAVSPNPSELLSSGLFGQMIDVMKAHYDYLIIDSAPLGEVIDAALVAKRCDGTILVVESGSADRRQAARVKGQLQAAGTHILGVVLNKMGGHGHGYYGKKGYGYYGKKGYGYGYGYGEVSNGQGSTVTEETSSKNEQ